MIAIDRLCIKLQEWFGGDFKIIPYHDVCRDYTTARQVVENGNIGYIMDYNDEYSKLKKEKIVGVVNLQNPQKANTMKYSTYSPEHLYYVSSSFTIDFSVPTNIVKRDINNEIIETPNINFFSKYEAVVANVANLLASGYIDFSVGSETTGAFKGSIVLNEPTFVGIETDGEIKYMTYRISGAFVVSKDAKFGAEYKLYIKNASDTYIEVKGINSFTESLDNNSNAINKQGTTKTQQNLSASGWVCIISFDDVSIISTENELTSTIDNGKKLLIDMLHENKEILYAGALTESAKRKVPVKITTPHGNTHTFNAIVTGTFRTSANGVGSYEFSFTDDNKG